MQIPTTLTGAIAFIVVLIVVAIVAVFLFQEIVLPLIRSIT